MKKLATSLILLLLTSSFLFAQNKHQIWDGLLQKYVSENGLVNYDGFKKETALLSKYLEKLAEEIPNEEWNRNESMAYWINAYNAFTVKLIIDNYPIKSIMDLKDGKPWDSKFFELRGEPYSLNKIEHEILRPTFKEARIHFAVNCASISCPKLHNRAFTAANVDQLLAVLAKNFINNETKNTISNKKVEISKIFDWYKEDFNNGASLIDFLNRYSTVKIQASTPITFKEYNWELNNK